ncbi:MAG: T9SS type A sorting domain-containing protein, partial [Bacteroidota bacterium]|nr:T9SS type A sorting domain-containing protein [Bacteroidota bacterium]
GWYTGVGGISYTGSFTWGDDTPAFVFCDRLGPNLPKMVAECCAHESGHALGLSHQSSYSSTCTLVATYNAGSGTGQTGWAPVMGNSYYKNSSGWNNGPTPSGCTSKEDNLLIISTSNGFTYRPDDFSDDPAVNPGIINISNQTFSISGLISTNTDKDAFKFILPQNGKLHINAIPYSATGNLDGASLDVKITLLNSSFQTIGIYDPPTILDAIIDTSLNAGNYFVVLQGTGNANASTYGSLGSYTISGTFVSNAALPIKDVALTGKADRGQHNLNWNIISDEPIRTLTIETSTDGTSFKTLTAVATSAKSFTYTPAENADIFYRLKVISIIDETAFSNVVKLKSNSSTEKTFKISTIVHNDIMVNASENYEYMLADISGRIIAKGNNSAGINRINISNAPDGIYVMQIISNNQRKTERIIKQ